MSETPLSRLMQILQFRYTRNFNIERFIIQQHTQSSGGIRSVVGYLAKELANHPFKETAEHFNCDPVVISKGIKGLEKKIREDETISTAILPAIE